MKWETQVNKQTMHMAPKSTNDSLSCMPVVNTEWHYLQADGKTHNDADVIWQGSEHLILLSVRHFVHPSPHDGC